MREAVLWLGCASCRLPVLAASCAIVRGDILVRNELRGAQHMCCVGRGVHILPAVHTAARRLTTITALMYTRNKQTC